MRDQEWVWAGVGCVVTGALLSIFTGKHRWFALGGVLGASTMAYRMILREPAIFGSIPDRKGNGKSRCVMEHREDECPCGKEEERLGAPEIPAVETPNVGRPEPLTRRDVEGFPMAFRVPDVEVHMDTMDYRIKPHFVGPLGPANDPVKYW